MKKKRMLMLISSIGLSLFLIGCGEKEVSFEDNTTSKLNSLRSTTLTLQNQVSELQKQVDSLKQSSNMDADNTITKDNVKFSSIKLETLKGIKDNGVVTVGENLKINLKIDILNASEKDLNQYDCQIYMKYMSGENTVDIYQDNVIFDAQSKYLKKDIQFKDIQIRGTNVKHVLTINIKDRFGNVITTYEKELKVR